MHVLENTDLKDLVKENDVLIVDRGFRDCKQELKEKYKLNVEMPFCTPKGEYTELLSTIDANKSRLVTKVRNVVECKQLCVDC